MPDLRTVHDTIEEIPEAYRDLYAEKDGKFELAGIVGIKTEGDVSRLQEALTKERNDHRDTKDKLKPWEGLEAEQVRERMDGWDELVAKAEAAGEGGEIDKEKLEELANARVVTATAPLKRDLENITKERDELLEENKGFKQREIRRTVTDAVRKAAVSAKIIPEAMEDVLLLSERVMEISEDGSVLTKDQVGCTPGIAPDIWLTEMQDSRPHWWPLSEGGGARGGADGTSFKNNPWAKDNWNMTEQGRVIREEGREKADQMAKAAGTTVGGPRPISTKDSK